MRCRGALILVGVGLLGPLSKAQADEGFSSQVKLLSRGEHFLATDKKQLLIEVDNSKRPFLIIPKRFYADSCSLMSKLSGTTIGFEPTAPGTADFLKLELKPTFVSEGKSRTQIELSCPAGSRTWSVDLRQESAGSHLEERINDALAAGFPGAALKELRAILGSPSLRKQMDAYYLLGRLFLFEGNYIEAAKYWGESFSLARQLGALWTQTSSLLSLLHISVQVGDYAEARACFDNLSALRQAFPILFEFPETIEGYSVWYSVTGETERQIDFLKQAMLKSVEQADIGETRRLANNLAYIKLNLGEYREARNLLAKRSPALDWIRSGCVADATKVEIELAEKEGNPNYLIPPQMMTFALELEKKLRGRRLDMWTFVAYALGRIAFLEGNYDKARDWLRRANTEVLPEQSASYRNDLDLLEGELSLVGGNYPKAIEIANRLIKKAVEQPVAVHSLAWRAYKLRAAAAEKSNLGTKKVSSDYQKAQLHLTSIARGVGQRTTRISFKTKYRQLPLQYADYLIRENKIGEGAAVLEHYRALVFEELNSRILTERLSEKGRQHWLNMLAKFEQARRKYERERGACELVPKAKLKGCQRGRRKDARKVSKLHQKVFEALKEVPPQLPKIERYIPSVQRMLLPGQALLTLTQTLSGWHSFYISARNVEHYHGPQPLSPWVDRLSQLEHLYVVAGGHKEARGLHRQVFKDKPLAAQISISYLPHAGVLIRPAVKAKQAGIVVADPEGDLPNAYQEAKKLLRLRKGLRSFLGETARREDILSSLSKGARWLHFAGHGIFAQEDPWAAHLKLADGETLSLEDLLVAQPKVELVVLNGCQTGPELSNEGMTLPQAFLLAGAQAVLATTDDIDDAQARRFIDSFYDSDPWANPGKAYRNAVIASASAGDEVWRSFRLWGAVGSPLR